MPEEIKAVLLSIGLSPAEWVRVRAAFDKVQESDAVVEAMKRLSVPNRWYEIERWFIERALMMNPGVPAEEIARRVGMNRSTFYRRLNALGLGKHSAAARQSEAA